MFPNDNICTLKAAKNAAKSIFQRYAPQTSTQPGLNDSGVTKMMKDTYETMNLSYEPSILDVNELSCVMDLNKDGKISLQDLEKLAMRYLCGVGQSNEEGDNKEVKKQESD